MNIRHAAEQYEHWLGSRTNLIASDLDEKHREMASSPFAFLRATYFRWAQRFPVVCPTLAGAPAVLSVGDLHVENFGTWRDVDGRLIWGVNDFDEAYPLPYAADLVRLAASTRLARMSGKLGLGLTDASREILAGYKESLQAGGRPYVLEESHSGLRGLALGALRDPKHFWAKMDAHPDARKVPASAIEAIEHLLPELGLKYRLKRRKAGLGSLGHQRFVGVANWRGGQVAREAKALVPSAAMWAEGVSGGDIFYQAAMGHAVRVPDPFVELRGLWVVRRLAPHCSEIELDSLPTERDERRLLHAMGWEAANIHLGTPDRAKKVLRHLEQQPSAWLHDAAAAMVENTLADYEEWRNEHSPGAPDAEPKH